MSERQRFEWDSHKAAGNAKKHAVTFDEATTVFADAEFITVVDGEHSEDEERYITIGMSDRGQLLIVAHTDRGGYVRIISARKATQKEAMFYAENT